MQKIIFAVLFLLNSALQASGNVSAGQAKATVCVACHGSSGISSVPMWPSLAGQHSSYLAKQLRDYQQDHTRHAAIMSSFVVNLSEQDQLDLAAYFASLSPGEPSSSPGAHFSRGKALYHQGDRQKQITACIACHGSEGRGNEEAGFPRVKAQQIDYTRMQLQAFKDKARSNDLNAIMRSISARMDEEDMLAVAEYMAAMH
jgi:cytochrome c553